MSVNIKTGPCVKLENPSLTFPYETDDFQNHSFNSIESGDHVLVTAHTGSGKTTVAEYAVSYGLLKKKKVIYTAPIKALSNQIFSDFKNKYPHWKIGIKTGDIDYNSESCDVLIMTTEIIRNLLFLNDLNLKDVSVVIFDEVHWIKDESRGSVWEESIIMMPEHIQMIMLSATLPDAVQFCQWIADCKKANVSYTTTSKRIVPLNHYVMDDSKMYKIMDNDGTFHDNVFKNFKHEFTTPQLNFYIPRMELPALFFCFSKKNCEKFAKAITTSLVDSYTANNIHGEFNELLRKFDDSYIRMPETHEMLNLLCKGVGYHHAGLLPPIKEIVQEMFSKGYIQVLFVTETFAAGVNMPAKTVVFTGFSKSTGDGKFRTLLPEEYNQMSGRAGRRGKDLKGTVIHLPFNFKRDALTIEQVKKMMSGVINPITSHFKIDYSYIIKNLWINDLVDLTYINNSLMSLQDNRLNELVIEEYKCFLKDFQDLKIPTKEALKVIELEEFLKQGYLSFKDKKKYLKETLPWITANIQEHENNKKYKLLKLKIEKFSRELENFKVKYLNYVFKLVTFLKENEYLNSNLIEEIKKDNITIKGLMLKEVNEVNPIMLTELVFSDYLIDLNFEDIIAILALFLDLKGESRDIAWSFKAHEVKRKYLKDMDLLEVRENSNICNWTTSDYLCDVSKLWVTQALGPDLHPILENYYINDLFPGEFVRMMLKLNNICKEVVKIAFIANKDYLIKKLDNCQSSIVRGIVTPQSLYVTGFKL